MRWNCSLNTCNVPEISHWARVKITKKKKRTQPTQVSSWNPSLLLVFACCFGASLALLGSTISLCFWACWTTSSPTLLVSRSSPRRASQLSQPRHPHLRIQSHFRKKYTFLGISKSLSSGLTPTTLITARRHCHNLDINRSMHLWKEANLSQLEIRSMLENVKEDLCVCTLSGVHWCAGCNSLQQTILLLHTIKHCTSQIVAISGTNTIHFREKYTFLRSQQIQLVAGDKLSACSSSSTLVVVLEVLAIGGHRPVGFTRLEEEECSSSRSRGGGGVEEGQWAAQPLVAREGGRGHGHDGAQGAQCTSPWEPWVPCPQIHLTKVYKYIRSVFTNTLIHLHKYISSMSNFTTMF